MMIRKIRKMQFLCGLCLLIQFVCFKWMIPFHLISVLLSLIVMWLIKKAPVFSTVGVSVSGAAAHNVGQLLAALIVIGFRAVMFYLPFLLVAGVITGFLVGLGASLIIKRVKLI